jgi:hypothetical protein
MTELQFAAQSYIARAAPLDAQRAINMFVERSPPDAKTTVPVFMCPGLVVFSRLGTGPINGMRVLDSTLYALSGGALYAVTQFGGATLIGQTNLGGIVSMADNDKQIVMVDGQVGWIYQPGGLNQVTTTTAGAGATTLTLAATGTLAMGQTIVVQLDNGTTHTTTIAGAPTGSPGALVVTLTAGLPSQATKGAIATVPSVVLGQITAPAFQAAATVVYFDGYFVFDAAGTNTWFISGLGDGTQYSTLDRASAQADPDHVLAVVNYHEQLLIFGGKTIEVWYDSGALKFPFQRFDGAFVQRGLAGPLAIVREDNTVLWLGEDLIFYRLDGYRPVRVSTFGTESAWAKYPTAVTASAFVVTIEGHKFIFLTFPSAQVTWCYDISSGTQQPLWHERESWGSAVV